MAATVLVHGATPEFKFGILAHVRPGRRVRLTGKSSAFAGTMVFGLPVQVGEVAEREGAHVVEGLRHSVVGLGHHSPEGERGRKGNERREREKLWLGFAGEYGR